MPGIKNHLNAVVMNHSLCCRVRHGRLIGEQRLVLARPYKLDRLAMANFANKVDNDVVLLDADAIEVLAHGQSQVVLVLATSLSLADHGR